MNKPPPSTEDFWVKLVSLVLAVMIWSALSARGPRESAVARPPSGIFSAMTQREPRLVPGVPITVLTAASDSRQFVVTPPVVSVTLAGEPEALQRLPVEEIEAYVNLADVIEAVGLRKQIRVRVPPGIRVEKLDPPAVEVKIIAQP